MRRYLFIYNPASGHYLSQKRVKKLKTRVEQLPQSRLIVINHEDLIPDIVDQLIAEYDVFVACGGDGTVREVATPLIKTGKSLGIIPMGSGNDFAKTVKIPKDIDRAFNILTGSQPVSIDTGRCNDFIFLNTLGFGFDGLTTRYASESKQTAGFFRYLFASLKANVNHENFWVDIRSDKINARRALIMATIANGKVEGGRFWLAPEASVTDGMLNLITVNPVSRFLLPIYLPMALIKKAHRIPAFNKVEVQSVKLSFDRKVAIHADGEVINSEKQEFNIRVHPKSLKVVCDPTILD